MYMIDGTGYLLYTPSQFQKSVVVVPAKTIHAVQFFKPPGATVALSSIFSSFMGTDFRWFDAL